MGTPDKRLVAAATISGAAGLVIGVMFGISIGATERHDAPPPTKLAAPPATPTPPPIPLPPPPPIPVPVAAPKPVPPPPREIGSSPYRLRSMTVDRWDGDAWRVRADLMVTRLREATEGTKLGTKLSCHVDGVVFVSVEQVGPPEGRIRVGETGPTYVDHFFHNPFKGTPQRCELMLYVQMPGAPADIIDHDAGRICVIPKGKKDQVTGAPCPLTVEAPLP